VLWAQYENDPAALAAAEAIGAQIESYRANVNPGSTAIAYWGSRSYARHTLLAIYLAQATGAQRWITLRDKLLDGLVQSPDWRAGAVGGNYFVSRDQMAAGGSSAAAYDAGRRLNSAFQFALHTEALWRGYLATGRADIRAKLVDIARWTEYYAHDPSYVNPMVGAWFGQNNSDLSRWHRDSDSGNANVNGSDPVYDTALVNTMVIGYKLTGSQSMLAMAKTLFRKGTLWPPGYRHQKHVADNEVHHYVDTLTNPDQFLFDYNKGELQYTYLLFENNGNPTLLTGPTPRSPTNVTVQ
jgi:hypothetical protein